MIVRITQLTLLLLFTAALSYAWHAYPTFDTITFIFRRGFGDVWPIYATWDPIVFASETIRTRLILAVTILLGSLLLLSVAVVRRWPACVCLLLTMLSTIAINVSLAYVREGPTSFTAPFARSGMEYYADVPAVNDAPAMFIRAYASISPTLSHHAGTHPPGGVLFLWAGSKMFGPSIEAAAWGSVCFGAVGVVPTYWLARQILGTSRARRVLPLYLVTPSLVIFGATSMDIVFSAFAAAALAAMFWAMKRLSVTRVLIAGALFWIAAFMTFAVISLPILAGVYALLTCIRRPMRSAQMIARLALVGVAFIAVQAFAERAWGYDFMLVADAAMIRDHRGVGVTGYESFELWRAFSIANVAAFAFGTGLALSAATLVGALTLPFQRPMFLRAAGRLALAVPICLLALTTSTLFTLETERVWLALVPAMFCVAAAIRGVAFWSVLIALLAAQTVLTECFLYTHW